MSNYSYAYSNTNRQWLGTFFKKAFAVGAMPESKRCQQCGRTGRIVRHHPNYNHPLSIVFLCQRCHSREHSPGWLRVLQERQEVHNRRISRNEAKLEVLAILEEEPDVTIWQSALVFDSDDFVAAQREESAECLSRRLEGTRKLSGAIRTFRF